MILEILLILVLTVVNGLLSIALKRELPPAIAELQAANIAPADMPQSAIGPGMGVFTRYATQELRPGDVVTAAVPGGVRSLRMRAPGARRGPPAEARLLYDDLDAPAGDAAPGAPWPDEDED